MGRVRLAAGNGDNMRLICPNCSAQYEVDDSAIPETGRDVQCSGCGHGWFQLPPGALAAKATAEEKDLSVPPVTEPENGEAAPEPPPAPDFADSVKSGVADVRPDGGETPAEEDKDTEESAAPDSPAPPSDGAQPAPAAKLDDALRAVLREEAEREARARRAESIALESQPDLGLADAPRPERPERGDSAERAPEAAATTPTRRKQLPDIEEINSSLRPASEHGLAMAPEYIEDEEAFAARRRGFRIGFMLALALAILLLALYVYAPLLAEMLPAAEPWLAGYEALLDGWRQAIAQGADAAIRALTEIIASFTG
ncbi:zinc-ribbon domain-containing protein [Alkalilacustris brevis]|uniref:zinc-ribbon domain-containing protein n=1 Tax=Alkalilacustris brevis TaxID=2026338 RepID=UPI00138FC26C|nr:zinc-ribbon domain-containing protein [Alkalilacustris brevis]